jgi:hypothetical protein
MTNDDIPADKLPNKRLSTSKAERMARSEETNRAALSTIEIEAETRRKKTERLRAAREAATKSAK